MMFRCQENLGAESAPRLTENATLPLCLKIRLNHNTRDVYMAKPPWIHSRRVTLFYISRCSKLFYSMHVGENQSDIALPYSFAPTTAFHQSRSPLRSFFKTAVGTK